MKKTAILILLALILMPSVLGTAILGEDCESAYALDPQAQAKCELETQYLHQAELFIEQNNMLMSEVYNATQQYSGGGGVEGDLFLQAEEISRNYILVIANLLLILVLMYGGYLWIISAADPEKRHYAKKILINFFYMVIFVNSAFFLFELAFDFSNSAVGYIAVNTNNTFFEAEPWQELADLYTDKDIEGSFNRYKSIQAQSRVLFPIGWTYLLLMHLRNIIVFTLFIVSPIILMLLLFVPTRPYGKLFLILFLVEIFVPVLFFIIFKVASMIFTSAPSYDFIIICSALAGATLLHLLALVAAVGFSTYNIVRGELA